MADVAMVAIFCIFFALAVAFVKGCEKIVGTDVETGRPEAAATDERTAA